MIQRIKRQTKRRHSVKRTGWSIRWKEGGYWRTTWPRWRSMTITTEAVDAAIVGALHTPDVFAYPTITYER